MKASKLLGLAVLAMASLVSSAAMAQTTVAVEYDYHKTAGTNTNTQYGAVGVIQGTKYGIFDGWLQGFRSATPGAATSTPGGYELGYAYVFPVGKFNLTPRVAYGTFNGVDLGGGAKGNARYLLTTIEGSTQLRDNLGLFANYSHTKGLNSDALQSINRYTGGVDLGVAKNTSLRLGVSRIATLKTNQNGVYAVVSYTLGQ